MMRPRLVLSMIVHNEADRYLRRALEAARPYITEASIVDDASTDGSGDVCREVLSGIPLRLTRNAESRFSNEVQLRQQQWSQACETGADWVLTLDADEVFEPGFAEAVPSLLADHGVHAYRFRLFDMWSETEYREDRFWRAHAAYRPFLVRPARLHSAEWLDQAQHCGRFPSGVSALPHQDSQWRLQHFGWAREADRKSKRERYRRLDPDARFGWAEQYESILDPSPRLLPWVPSHSYDPRPRVLVASALHKPTVYLREFFASLERVHEESSASMRLSYRFVDDLANDGDLTSSQAEYRDFLARVGAPSSETSVVERLASGQRDWAMGGRIARVTEHKNGLLRYALDHDFDAVFLIDADVVVHPATLRSLASAGKDIIAMLYYWDQVLPQVWLSGFYYPFQHSDPAVGQSKRMVAIEAEFLDRLSYPGVYPVGGLGACTWVSRKAIAAGVSFSPHPRTAHYRFEDRDFCARASDLGFSLHVDTRLPAYHMQRDEPAHREEHVRAAREYARQNDKRVSRFIRSTDSWVMEVGGLDLPNTWWSRGHEYAWAMQFAHGSRPGLRVLDAACGLSHPLKFALTQAGCSTDACDIDAGILDPETILAHVKADFGPEAEEEVRSGVLSTGHLRLERADLVDLPYPADSFDRVFCVSVFEHMERPQQVAALREFRRVLAPGGRVVLTVDVPSFDVATLPPLLAETGLRFAGPVDLAEPLDALASDYYGPRLRCFRALLGRA